MKSYNHLYEQFISDENIYAAIKSFGKNTKDKKKKKKILKIKNNPEESLERVKKCIRNFKHAEHTPIIIYDGISKKKRTIIVPTIDEQIVHHMIINVLKPIIMHGMYEHAYGSLPKRGIHKAAKKIKRIIRKNNGNIKFCLKMDIQKFFNSINREDLVNFLKKKIHDEKFLKVLLEVIDSTEDGLPLGFYTSHWLAHWILQDLDHFIKEKLHAYAYIRYVDDMVIFGPNKRKLHKMRKEISNFLYEHYHLKLKENWQVFRFDYIKHGKHRGRPLDFLVFKFYRDRIVMRKNIMLKISRKCEKIAKKENITIHDMCQLIAYLGWPKHTDSHDFYVKHVRPCVNPRKVKIIMSEHNKKMNKKKGEIECE